MPDRADTRITALSSLEARRNEELVLAEGALLGERRAALGRIAMVIMFATTAEVLPRLAGEPVIWVWSRQLAGLFYVLFTLGLYLRMRRARPDPRLARWMPVLTTIVDFSWVTWVARLDQATFGTFSPEMPTIACALLLSFSISRINLWHVAFTTVCACAAFLHLSWYFGTLHQWSTVFVISGYLALGVLIGLTNRAVLVMFRDLRRRDNLTRFLPRQVAERVLAHGSVALAPVQRDVTVLFSDIRDFTALAEHMPPRAVLQLLDDYFGRMAQIVKGHEGVVGKFLGDGLLAFWGVPDPDPDHAARAVRAAIDMQRALVELNLVRAQAGLEPLRIGIGVHTGPVAAGMLGSAEQSEYTVIGDAVNLASRLEGLTKTLGADLVVSELTYRLVEGRFAGHRLAEENIRGRREPVVVFAIDPPTE